MAKNLLFFTFIILFHFNCSNIFTSNSSEDQIAHLQITQAFILNHPIGDPYNPNARFNFSGEISAGDDIYLEKLLLNGASCSDSVKTKQKPGKIIFSTKNRMTFSDNYIFMELTTNLGKIIAKESIPAPMPMITKSCGDTLHLNDSLVVSWPKTDADFYTITGQYTSFSDNGNFYPLPIDIAIDTVTNQTDFSFDFMTFDKNGHLLLEIAAVNGPYKSADEYNIDGDGKGALTVSSVPQMLIIPVGDGGFSPIDFPDSTGWYDDYPDF